MDVLHSKKLDDLRIKHPESEDIENMKKGLALLKEAMTNLKIVLGHEPDVESEHPGTGSGDTEVARSTDESPNPTEPKKGRGKTRRTKKRLKTLRASRSPTTPDAPQEPEQGSVLHFLFNSQQGESYEDYQTRIGSNQSSKTQGGASLRSTGSSRKDEAPDEEKKDSEEDLGEPLFDPEEQEEEDIKRATQMSFQAMQDPQPGDGGSRSSNRAP